MHTRFALLVLAWACSLPPNLPAAVPPTPRRLCVVAPNAFHSALRDFVAYKRTHIQTELVSLEKILADTPGVDAPEKLKRYLYQQWRDHDLGYALLVGDVDALPVRYMVLDRVTPAAFDYAFYPSDLYYADLAKADGSFEDWNARKDSFHAGYFGEVRGEKNKGDQINFDQIDYRPEIAVGRWPVSTPAEVSHVSAKSIAYEQAVLAGNQSQFRRAALLSVGGWVDSRPLIKQLAGRLAAGWQVQELLYSDPSEKSNTPPNHERVRALFEQNIGLIVHTGHGEPNGWDQCFSLGDLATLTNALTPVVISAGCSTAYFAPLPPYDGYEDVNGQEHSGTDHHEVFSEPPPPPSPYQHGRFNPSGLGEHLLKHSPGGAVAYIGCDTGSQPCALTLVDGFVQALAKSKSPRLGDCWADAVRFYYEREHLADLKPNDDWYPPSIFFQAMKFMVFGDPSLRLPENHPISD